MVNLSHPMSDWMAWILTIQNLRRFIHMADPRSS